MATDEIENNVVVVKTETSSDTEEVSSKADEDGDKTEAKPDEVCLLFLGTFDHESSGETNADLVQFKGNVRITEIRIIPLGAEVALPNGSCQLGATNPAQLHLEFYYNDLQNSTKPTFTLLDSFSYDEKCQIQLSCEGKDPEILTDVILIRGQYSTVTLALYGYPVGEESIKQIGIVSELDADSGTFEALLISAEKTPEMAEAPEGANLTPPSSILFIKTEDTSPDIRGEVVPEMETPRIQVEVKPEPVPTSTPPRAPLTIEVPQAIPTISTRVNFSPIKIQIQQPEPMEIDPVEAAVKAEIVSSDEEQFEDHSFADAQKLQEPNIMPLLMETEDISDGEISDEAEEVNSIDTERKPNGDKEAFTISDIKNNCTSEKLLAVRTASSTKEDTAPTREKTSYSQQGSPHELLSDQEDSFGDEFPDSAVEEIISDEEMPDYGDYEYNEWDDIWLQKFTRGFNPLLESYQVRQLRNLKFDVYLRRSNYEDKFSASKLLGAISKFSESEFDYMDDGFIENWVEKMEQLLPALPQALNAIGEEDQEVLKAVRFWIRKGLDLDLVNNHSSIHFKLRHIKAGLKLVHCVCNYGGFIAEDVLKLLFDDTPLQYKLLDVLMHDQLKTIISIQTLTLKSLDATLSTRLGFQMFCNPVNENESVGSGFHRFLNYFVDSSTSTRVSYALRTFLNKITIMSNIQTMQQIVQTGKGAQSESESPNDSSAKLLEQEVADQCLAILGQISEIAHKVDQSFAYPTRILPADTVVELPPVAAGHDPKLNFMRLLKESELLAACAALLNCKQGNEFATPICDLIKSLLCWEEGLVYLSAEAEHTTLVIKALLRFEERRSIALECAHCLEVMRCIDSLTVEFEMNTISDSDEDIQCLQQLYSFLVTPVGREALARTLSLGNLVAPLLDCIRDDTRLLNNSEKLSRLVKSARRGYALDLLIFIVKFSNNFDFLKNHGLEIHDLIISLNDHYEGCDKLSELFPYLKPTLDKVHFTYDGIESLCTLIKSKLADFLQAPSCQEQNWGFYPEIVTALRILCHLGTSDEDDVTTILQWNSDIQTSRQLKFMMAYVKMNNEDLLSHLMTILGRVGKEFEHPAMQSYLLAGSKGDALLSLLLPLVHLFRRILTRTVQVRNTEFRDLSPVPILLQVYSLVNGFPEGSLSHAKADEVGVHIVNTLLAYTIPTMKIGEESEDELTKSVWTAMINEIIKFTWLGPANFVPGITVLSELLPFPFPIQTNVKLTEEERLEWIRQKRLWSAYLHGASSQIQEMIGVLCESAHPELLSTLKQMCLKLADLSAASCLVVCRAIMNQIIASMEVDFEKSCPQRTCDSTTATNFVKAWVEAALVDRTLHCSARTARLLDFFASLISSNGIFKAGMTHIYRGLTKVDEKFIDFISMLCSILTSWPTKDLAVHAQGQRHVVTIFQALCDVEFNLFLSGADLGSLENLPSSDFIRPNSIPQRETLTLMCSAFLTYLNSFDLNITALKACVAENVLHALQIISETEYGFCQLRISLSKHSESLNSFTKKLARPLQDENAISPMIEIVTAYTNFLNCLVTPKEDPENLLAVRQNVLTVPELWKFLAWSPEASPEGQNLEIKQEEISQDAKVDIPKANDIDTDKAATSKGLHPLLQLKGELDKWIRRIDENQEIYQIYASLDGSLETLNKFIDLMSQSGKISYSPPSEVLLAAPDGLAEVFAHRSVSVLLEERIPISSCYLTSFPTAFFDDIEQSSENELVKCDLIEMARAEVPALDLVKELEGFFKRTLPSNINELRNPAEINLKLKSEIEFSYQQGERGINTGLLGLSPRKPNFNSGMRGNSARVGFGRGMMPGAGRPGQHFDPFRSRPPNTSRPPSLHVDDFVALESSSQGPSGQSSFHKPGARTGVGRRGPSTGRPFNNLDRGRPYRSPQTGSPYYQRNDGTPLNSTRGRGGGRARGYNGGGGNQRWGNTDSHSQGQSQGFSSGRVETGRNYEDKFRGGPGRTMRTSMGGRQSFSRNANRDTPNSGRTSGSNNSGMNSSSAPRWRDRQRPFNR